MWTCQPLRLKLVRVSFCRKEWEKSEHRGSSCVDLISEEDTHSLPDSLPDLIDSVWEEERPFPIELIKSGIANPGILLIPG